MYASVLDIPPFGNRRTPPANFARADWDFALTLFELHAE